jgi:hypothetical protein
MPILPQLKSIRALLQSANHDYKGHRAKAVKEIGYAIHLLQPRVKHVQTPVRKPLQPNREPQALSDAQLREAIDQLQSIQAQIAGRHPRAEAALLAATKELKIALTIR